MLAQNRRPRSHAQDQKTNNTPPPPPKKTELNYTIGVILIISCLKKL